MGILIAVFATAAAISMWVAAVAMVYDTTLPHPGIGDRGARIVMVLWLWPVAIGSVVGLSYGLGYLWAQAL